MSTWQRLLCSLCLLSILSACQSLVRERVVTPEMDVTATYAAAQAATEAVPTATATLTPTPDPFPTPVIGAIYVAEQRFEGGWMFWLQPNQQIWLLTVNDRDEHVWSVYNDEFVEGDAEIDAEILSPEGKLQPIRGFGQLWRENLEVREAIGWALEEERGHTTRYEFHHGGRIRGEQEYLPAPGYHLVEGLYGDTFRFNETDSSWEVSE